MDDRSPFRHGLLRIQDGGQDLVLDLDGLARALGQLRVVCGHHGHAVSHEAHLVVEHHRVVGRRLGPALTGGRVRHARHVFVREDADDPGHGAGLAGVDAGDAGVRVRGVEDARVQHPRHLDVVDERAAPGGELDAVHAPLRPADRLQIRHRQDLGPLAAARAAARITASTGLT